MTTIADLQLSAELQELYLENKEWTAQLQFLKDEYRFFTKLFDAEQIEFKERSEEQVLLVQDSLSMLKEKIEKLEELASQHKQLIESILKNKNKPIDLSLIELSAALGEEVKLLLSSDRQIKKELFKLVEGEKNE